jgi:hypothetical protein
MNWSNIEKQIRDSIKVGDKLQEDSTYRNVIAGQIFLVTIMTTMEIRL